MNRSRFLSARVIYLFGLLSMMVWSGCKSENRSPKTLVLTLRTDSTRWRVADFEVSAKTYEGRSSESGLYQVRMVDKKANVLARVGLGRLVIQQLEKQGRLKLRLPCPDQTQEVLIYRMDGSSGHYTLKQQDPLLRWTLPG